MVAINSGEGQMNERLDRQKEHSSMQYLFQSGTNLGNTRIGNQSNAVHEVQSLENGQSNRIEHADRHQRTKCD